jgi:hypothetical protein
MEEKAELLQTTKHVSTIPFKILLAICFLNIRHVSRNGTDESVSTILTLSHDFYSSL